SSRRRYRAAGRVTNRKGADLSDASGALHRQLPSRWRARHRRTLDESMADGAAYSSQQFVIENRPGGGTNTATEAVVRAPADGYTLVSVAPTSAINATLYNNLNFNFIRDIAPVAAIFRGPYIMLVHPSVQAKTIPEFIAYAKSNPGKLNMASAGTGTGPHVA